MYKSRAQIDKLLRDYGCEAAQWTEDYNRNFVELRFVVEVDMGGDKRKLGVKLSPPLFMEKRKTWNSRTGKHDTVQAPNFSQAYRLMYWYLKAKLAAVAYGIRPFEEEFLSEIVVHTERGEERLVDVLKNKSPTLLGLPPVAPIQESHNNEPIILNKAQGTTSDL